MMTRSKLVSCTPIRLVVLGGFNLIITTAHNEDYCRAAGATHIIDYRTTPYALIPVVVKEITRGPAGIISNAIYTHESQRADWEILESNGGLVPPEILIYRPNQRAIGWLFKCSEACEMTVIQSLGLAMSTAVVCWGPARSR
jgi:hypothetical protein